MKNVTRTLTRSLAIATLLVVGGGCTSSSLEAARRDVEFDLRPAAKLTKESSVATPDLDERDDDKQFLSRINTLSAQVNEYQERLAVASEEREEAVTGARAARENEAKLAEYNEELQQLLDDTRNRERELQDELLRARLEIVQLKKDIQLRRIRELTDKSDG